MQTPYCKLSADRTVSAPVVGPVLNVDALAAMLHRDRATILADRCRAPERVPPAHKAPGTKEPLWLLDEVLTWLRSHPDFRRAAKSNSPRRRPGRPRKIATPACRVKGVLSV